MDERRPTGTQDLRDQTGVRGPLVPVPARAFPARTARSIPGRRSAQLVFAPMPVGDKTRTAAPAGTPDGVLTRVNRETDAIFRNEETLKKLREMGFSTSGAGTLKGGRHLKYKDHTPMTNLLLTVLDKAGVRQEKLGDSTEKMGDL